MRAHATPSLSGICRSVTVPLSPYPLRMSEEMATAPTARPASHPRSRVRETVRVDLWLRSVDEPPDDKAVSCLDVEERLRADRFLFERDRIRFLNRRALLREVLAAYLGVPSWEIRLRATEGGWPELQASNDVAFNASHSHGVAVVAVTRGPAIGVDIERLRPVSDALDLAEGLFCEREAAALRSSPAHLRSNEFLTLWTRKESVLKASRAGLTKGLDVFDVLGTTDGIGRPIGPEGALPFVFSDFGRPPVYTGTVTVASAHAIPVIERRTSL